MATEAPDAPQTSNPLADSRNLLPSFFRQGVVGLVGDDGTDEDYVPAFVDIDEPLSIEAGQQKVVDFQYNSGVPQATAFGITWHATEADAEAQTNILHDEPVPRWVVSPQTPGPYTGALEPGTVELVAPPNMRAGIVWGNMAIYQIRAVSTSTD